MTEHPSLVKPSSNKLSKLEETLSQAQAKPLQVIPIGIVETAPIVENLQENTTRQIETLHETVKTLNELKETADSPEINAKLDRLLEQIDKIGKTAELEREVLQKLNKHPELNR